MISGNCLTIESPDTNWYPTLWIFLWFTMSTGSKVMGKTRQYMFSRFPKGFPWPWEGFPDVSRMNAVDAGDEFLRFGSGCFGIVFFRCGILWLQLRSRFEKPDMSAYFYQAVSLTSSTAQGGGGSFKNRKPIGEIGCCESGMAERIHWWTEKVFEVSSLSLSFSNYLLTYQPIFYVSIYLSIDRSIYLSLSLSLSLSFISLPIYLSTYLPTYLPIYLSTYLPIYLSTYLPIYLCTYLSIYLPIYLSIYLSLSLPLSLSSVYPSSCLPVCLSIGLTVYLSMCGAVSFSVM